MDPYAALKPGLTVVDEVHPAEPEPTDEEEFSGNVPWRKFKLAFQQTAMMMPGADRIKPKNRKELRDLLRKDPTLAAVRTRVFGDWRKR